MFLTSLEPQFPHLKNGANDSSYYFSFWHRPGTGEVLDTSYYGSCSFNHCLLSIYYN